MNYTETLNTLINYYTNLLIVQYHEKPKAIATIKMAVELLCADMALMQVRDAFDWQTAIGEQLNIIGDWVGCDRFYDGQLFYFHPWFSLIDWDSEPDNLQWGFSTFDTFEDNSDEEGGFLHYDDIAPNQYKLEDDAYRIMIGLKIIKNSISATCKNIDDAIWDYFEGKVYTTWADNVLTYYYDSTLSVVIPVAQAKGVLPAPVGVTTELKEISE